LLVSMDKRFSELLARRRIWMIAGMDVFESRFVVPGWLWSSSVVVDPEQSRWYFGEPRMVPNSDHFSIAKPTKDKNSADHYPHEYLMEFYELRFVPEIRALSRCQSSAASHPSSFAEYFSRMRDGVRPARDVGIQVAQLGSDVFPGSVDQACYTAKLSELRQRQSLQAVGGVRCEGGGLAAKGQTVYKDLALQVPSNMRIVCEATVQGLSVNRGHLGQIEYDSHNGERVGAKVRITCQSPSLVFGPGAWA
jgi:hypothetical protein